MEVNSSRKCFLGIKTEAVIQKVQCYPHGIELVNVKDSSDVKSQKLLG